MDQVPQALMVPQIPQHLEYPECPETFPDSLVIKPKNAVSAAKQEFHHSITISDDQSILEKVEERRLLALRDRNDRNEPQIRRPFERLFSPLRRFDDELAEKKRQQEEANIAWAGPSSAKEVAMGETAASTHTNANGKRDATQFDFLDLIDNDVSGMSLEDLQGYLQGLQKRAKHLKAIHEKEKRPTFRYQVLYRILQYQKVESVGAEKLEKCLSPPFFDPPEQLYGQEDNQIPRCKVPVQNFDLFLERNKDVSFIVYHTYVVGPHNHSAAGKMPRGRNQRSDISLHVEECIQPVAPGLIQALETILGSRNEYAAMLQAFGQSLELEAPYLFMYYHCAELETLQRDLEPEAREQFTMFSNYIMQQHGAIYANVDSMISKGNISSARVDYLFKPGDVLVSRNENSYRGWVATSFARSDKPERMGTAETEKKSGPIPLHDSHAASRRMANDTVLVHHFSIDAWSWGFDGSFQRQYSTLKFTIQAEPTSAKVEPCSHSNPSEMDEKNQAKEVGVPISELRVFPISFATPEIVKQLRNRGRIFWQCRTQRYVSYRDERDRIQGVENERYMVDLKTYRRLHRHGAPGLKDELGPEAIARDDPPDEQFMLLLPTKIKGYNMRLKKWHDLNADQISDIQWNKEAFQKVVIDRKAKDLIRALISNQIAMEESTDLIEGKGNGLILLLHGSPGTGKTLTAESVAEIAEKPLYRVTCGDVGTKAEDVEKYLESVFHLGKLWDCVVLLDEADVFLEQRSLEDLQRNALVSVFLRMLEYYDGILILTSNRVGIFDEAFKSRIQLALHYPNLGPYQRLRIWENFIERLASFHNVSVDIADLRDNLEKLGEEKMNGRQIRNAITTARQYAAWKKTTLTYEHLRDVIEVSGRFDKYLNQLNGGFTQDQLAEDEGIRLA